MSELRGEFEMQVESYQLTTSAAIKARLLSKLLVKLLNPRLITSPAVLQLGLFFILMNIRRFNIELTSGRSW